MRKYGVFDILGPIMIGPSSSHTAGAARLGKLAGSIADGPVKKVTFLLHGSFAKTYRGHGTDRALVAGILGMDPWDEQLRDSIDIAEERGIEIKFQEADLGDVHPNTVKFIIEKEDGDIVTVMGSSIGGGSVVITEVNGEEIEFTGEYPTIIIHHKDLPGMISKVTRLLYEKEINIAFMKVFRTVKGSSANMIFETDNEIPENIVEAILAVENIEKVKVINPVKEGEI
ncbi:MULTISPECIES: L-serine ammonia-lyase, iron-sulfur-dependent subunit beta [Clostridium]|uniref:L-serine deaminase n=1 Tax=Clostridium cadaveris TaxID=1529 RepID=A0A1I2KEI2_9CLOT|nr:L-serine ammonia-lyase, iron-sulfur-dependent subunit beta [Clostridium cadaveris]MDU4952114.1 L-serine ammonia-lyase, iron-sulfur-dependent subunit beta [Clostridium sp.]MDM8310569.1 L-serine ammonia-lyase, iron-sulfur-dependent subunit beta [Clostridium cadaveris]NME65120.1 L-serine ammonia-lyase, iron-sulfur-dependent, subunit beta [Clostridium cadaveris]NWK11422.1 L-serine ammonia-lyase, iron-sulfur-dependent, subunit beta [Clostridium cadaveris]PWL55014.1 MAG: L-serine ammonia-lyase, i